MTTGYMRLSIGVALGVMTFASFAALAEEQAAQQNQNQADVGNLEEVIVTAQKRQESAQRVPIAISTFTAAAVENMGIKTTEDLPLLVPGFQFVPAGGALAYYLRGVGTGTTNPGVESEVSTFVDGVFMPFQLGNVQSFNNIVGVEVDKGPQGTLFGRNATGGVIQIRTRDPAFQPQVEGDVGYGNYNTATTSFYATAPISDKVAADLAFHYDKQFDGFGKDLANGQDVFKTAALGVRSKWLIDISDNTAIRFTVDYSRSDGTDGAVVKPARANGFLYDYLTDRLDFFPGFYNVNSDTQPHWTEKQGGVSMKLDSDFGVARFVSITAWRKMSSDFFVDYDGTPIAFAPLEQVSRDEAESQELQLISPDDSKLKWVVGTFLYNESGSVDPFRFGGLSGNALFGAPPGEPYDVVDFNKTRSYALFGETTVNLGADTRLTLGARYTIDQKKIRGYTLAGTTIVPGSEGDQSKDYYRPTWNVTLDHNFTADFLAYASYRRGFHSGTFNSDSVGGFSPAANPPLSPEVIDAYEIGFKSEWLDRKLRVNASPFLYKYNDLQLQLYKSGAVITANAARAEIKGVDVDVTARPIRSVTLSTGFEYLNARYNSYPNAPIYSLAANGSLLSTPGDASGREMTNAPKVSFNILIGHELLTELGAFNSNAALFYNSGSYQDPGNFYKEPRYYVLNVSEKWTAQNGKFDITVWAKNLNDARYNYSVVMVTPVGAVGNAAPPRTYGATLGFRF